MKLIVAEKPIAGRRIAELLADSKVTEKRINSVPTYHFERNNEPCVVIPLRGHIKDVDFPKRYSPWVGTDLKALVYSNIEYAEKERNIISLLKGLATQFNIAIFATDYDREGESIALEALECLQETNPNIETKRAVFSAITKQDIEQAFNTLKELDFNLADSANARREIDLIWGAVLTRFLSLVSGQLGKEFLSAGRVQSPTLALIVDREKEILAFKPRPYWEIEAIFEKDSKKFSALHKQGRFWEKEKALAVLKKKEPFGVVSKITIKEKTLKRPEPFNTTSFLRAATSLGFSAARAMSLAEDLYNLGYISYPRTDNAAYPATINLRKIVQTLTAYNPVSNIAKELLSKERLVPSRGKSARDHPPIHPVALPKERLSDAHTKIYELICRRFLATLSSDAVVETIAAEILVGNEPFIARGQRYIELGWKKVYPYSQANEVLLPKLKEGETVKLLDMKLHEKKTKPPARYSQSALIKAMADLGLGTKSTRHEIIQKLYARGYIKGNKAIIPNRIAFAVIDSLEKHDGLILKPEMTANLEKEMDEIALGKRSKKGVVEDSRKLLLQVLDQLLENKVSIGQELRKAIFEDRKQFACTAEHCDGSLVVRRSKSGKRFLGCTNYPKCTVTFPLPQKGKVEPLAEKCPVCGKPMIKVTGRRYSYKMCIDPNCKSKDEWKNKTKEKNNGEQNNNE